MVNGRGGSVTEHQREAILDRWAKRDAAKAISTELSIPNIKLVHNVIRDARIAADPRAIFLRGSLKASRVVEAKRKAGRRQRGFRLAYPEMGFGVETIFVTSLGAGSVQCIRVPVSVSTILHKSTGG